MKRKIICIHEDKCNGCGKCASACPEGAIQMINGKAKLVNDLYCDGLGACIGDCPVDAINIEEREAGEYDENKVMENIIKQGDEVIKSHLSHLKEHNQTEYYNQAVDFLKKRGNQIIIEDKNADKACGCPGSMAMDFRSTDISQGAGDENNTAAALSQLRQWPIQLHLVNPDASYFKDADLLIAADCTAFSHGNFHNRFLKAKTLIVFCPKLDDSTQVYIGKLARILKNNNIKSITALHMQVPCCFATMNIIQEALNLSGKNILVKEYTISLRGEIV